jgi:hypothetical protein
MILQPLDRSIILALRLVSPYARIAMLSLR